jgi:type III secretion system YscQ/HrcQ family protein
MNSPVALRKDMLHLACAMLDEEVFELFLGGIQPDWRPRIEASETSTRLILKLMPAQSSEVHTFDLYMSYATAWNWLADLRWQAPPLADEVSPVKHLQFTAVLHLGETRLTTCDFERLQTGDALYLGQTRSANTERIEAVIGAYVFHVRSVEAESWICENLQQQTEKKMTFDSSHPNDEELEADITDQPLISIDALPVKLVFTLGSVNMTLAQIRTLAAGGVINLHRPASATVNILANGKLLGTGELIDVDDRLAVEITTMSRPTDEPD